MHVKKENKKNSNEEQKPDDTKKQKKAFVTSVAYDEKNKIFGICTTDSSVHFYIKTKVGIEYLKSVKAECIQNRIFYMPHQLLWLTAGTKTGQVSKGDYKLRHWDISRFGNLLQ